MEEAAALTYGNQLQDVYATILILIRQADPLAFYERHERQLLIEDFLRRDLLEDLNHSIINELLTYLQG